MNARQRLGEIVKGIRADIKCCQALLPVLTEQQRLLARHDNEALTLVGEQVNAQLERLSATASNRVRALKALGLEPNQQGIQVLVNKLPAPLNGQLRDQWQELEIALSQCQALNERNGELLASQRLALAELTGRTLSPYDETR